jgi:hypothetical protein
MSGSVWHGQAAEIAPRDLGSLAQAGDAVHARSSRGDLTIGCVGRRNCLQRRGDRHEVTLAAQDERGVAACGELDRALRPLHRRDRRFTPRCARGTRAARCRPSSATLRGEQIEGCEGGGGGLGRCSCQVGAALEAAAVGLDQTSSCASAA